MAETKAEGKFINPLWIISLFFSFSELALGYAVFNTTGGIQVALTCFVITFPILVAASFFALLWFRPEHLYAPRDFTNDEAFLRSLAGARESRVGLLALDAEIEERVQHALTSEDFVRRVSMLEGGDLRATLQGAAAAITNEIRESNFLTVSLARFEPTLEDLTLPVGAFSNFNELTNEIFFALEGRIEPFTYGTSWVLQDKESHKIFAHARMISGVGPGVPLRDDRPLSELGISAGMCLEALPLTEPEQAEKSLGSRLNLFAPGNPEVRRRLKHLIAADLRRTHSEGKEENAKEEKHLAEERHR